MRAIWFIQEKELTYLLGKDQLFKHGSKPENWNMAWCMQFLKNFEWSFSLHTTIEAFTCVTIFPLRGNVYVYLQYVYMETTLNTEMLYFQTLRFFKKTKFQAANGRIDAGSRGSEQKNGETFLKTKRSFAAVVVKKKIIQDFCRNSDDRSTIVLIFKQKYAIWEEKVNTLIVLEYQKIVYKRHLTYVNLELNFKKLIKVYQSLPLIRKEKWSKL